MGCVVTVRRADFEHRNNIREVHSFNGIIGHEVAGPETLTFKIDFECDSCGATEHGEGIGTDETSACRSLCEEMVNRFGWSSFDMGRGHHCPMCKSAGDRTFEFEHPIHGGAASIHGGGIVSQDVPEPTLDTTALDEVEELLKGDT